MRVPALDAHSAWFPSLLRLLRNRQNRLHYDSKFLFRLSQASGPVESQQSRIDMVTEALMIRKIEPGVLIHWLYLDTIAVDREAHLHRLTCISTIGEFDAVEPGQREFDTERLEKLAFGQGRNSSSTLAAALNRVEGADTVY